MSSPPSFSETSNDSFFIPPQPVKQEVGQKSEKRIKATQREKCRLLKINQQIEQLRQMTCPNLQKQTKSNILRHALERIRELEHLYSQLSKQEEAREIEEARKRSDVSNIIFSVQWVKPQIREIWEFPYMPFLETTPNKGIL